MSQASSKEQIIAIAQELLARDGLEQVSFDAIARMWGRSKQAVLYWYPTKQALLAALFLPALTAEAEAVERALLSEFSESEAIAAFVKAMCAFHLSDLPRFRMMYLAPQLTKTETADLGTDLLESVHLTTARTYAALAMRLDGEPEVARQRAVAIHASVLGLLLMHGLAEHLRDPLKYGVETLADALITSLTPKVP